MRGIGARQTVDLMHISCNASMHSICSLAHGPVTSRDRRVEEGREDEGSLAGQCGPFLFGPQNTRAQVAFQSLVGLMVVDPPLGSLPNLPVHLADLECGCANTSRALLVPRGRRTQDIRNG